MHWRYFIRFIALHLRASPDADAEPEPLVFTVSCVLSVSLSLVCSPTWTCLLVPSVRRRRRRRRSIARLSTVHLPCAPLSCAQPLPLAVGVGRAREKAKAKALEEQLAAHLESDYESVLSMLGLFGPVRPLAISRCAELLAELRRQIRLGALSSPLLSFLLFDLLSSPLLSSPLLSSPSPLLRPPLPAHSLPCLRTFVQRPVPIQ